MSKRLWIVLGLLALFAVACATPEEKKTAFYDKGVAFFEAGEYIKARLEFKNALQIDPEFAPAYYMLGKNAIKLKDGKAAYKSFMTAVRFDPEMIDARLDLGKMLFAGRAHDRAMAEVEEILKRAPGNTDALYLKASILLAQKKNEEAGILLDAVSQTGDEHPEFYLLRASYYSQKKNDKAVLTSLEKGFERHPDSLSMALALTRYYGKKRDIDRVEYYLGRAIEISPETLRLRFNLAWIHLKKNDLEKARLVLNRIITTHPGQDSLRVGASVLLLKGGQEAAAVDMIREGIAQSPSIYSYYALLSEVELKRDNMPEAETVLNRFLALGDDAARADQIKARLNLSKLMLLENRFEDADNMIAAILEEDLQNIDAHYLKGRILLARKDGTGAVTKFRSVVSDYPDHIEGYLGLASAHALNEDYDLALEVLKKALKHQPDSTGILEAMVKINLKKDDKKAAEENLKKIVSLDPYNLGSIAGLGDFYMSMNRYEDAIAQYRRLKKQEDGSAFGYIRTAQTLVKQDKVDEAIKEMNKGYEANRKSSVFITSLAQLYIKEGRYKEAIAKLEEALRVDAKNKFAWFSLAQIYERVENYDTAMRVYRDILVHHPDSWMAANNLAFYLAEFGKSQGEFDEALRLALEAERLNPGTPVVQDTLGWIHYRKGAFDKAQSHILKAHQQMPDNDAISYHLGAVYHRLGKYDKASGTLEKALAANAPFLGRAEASQLYNRHYAKN